MKRAVYLILALAMCFSLCACQHTDKEETERKAAEIAAAEALAAKQESACKKADSTLKNLAETSAKMIPTTYKSEVKVVDGKKVYVGTWDHPIVEFSGDADKFLSSIVQPIKSYTMPTLETYFSDCEMYAVIYIKMMGQAKYRLIDSRLDSSVADKLN